MVAKQNTTKQFTVHDFKPAILIKIAHIIIISDAMGALLLCLF